MNSAVHPPNPIRLMLRIDADATIGFGHAVRCSALIEALGSGLNLIVAGDNASALAPLFPVARIRSVAGEGFDSILLSEQPDAVIIDLPCHTEELWRKLRSFARLVISVDDEGGAVDADLVINGAGPESYHCYPALRPDAVALTGPAYVLLRPPFRRTRWRVPDAASVSIVAGSGARARDWAFALAGDALDRSSWGEIRMAVSGSFPDLPQLRYACECAGIHLVSGLDAQTMAEHVASARVALITGGMIMPETLAVGTPAVVFPQVDNMVPETRWFAGHGAVRDLGYHGGMDMAQVRAEVERLLSDRSEARTQSARGRQLVDGRGAERAARAILSRLVDGPRDGVP